MTNSSSDNELPFPKTNPQTINSDNSPKNKRPSNKNNCGIIHSDSSSEDEHHPNKKKLKKDIVKIKTSDCTIEGESFYVPVKFWKKLQ